MAEPKLTEDEWTAIKVEYQKGTTVYQLAKRYGVSRFVIQRKAKKEGWVRPDAPEETRAVSVEIVRERQWKEREFKASGARPQQPEFEEKDGWNWDEDLSSQRERLIQRHRKQWEQVTWLQQLAFICLSDETFRPADAEEHKWRPQDRINYAQKLLQMYNTAATAMAQMQEGQRRAFSFDYKDQREEEKSIGLHDEERQRLIEQVKRLMSAEAEQPLEGDVEPPRKRSMKDHLKAEMDNEGVSFET